MPTQARTFRVGAQVSGVGVGIPLSIAGSLDAWAAGAPKNVAHLGAFLGLGAATALISRVVGIPGIYPPRSDRLALVTKWLTPDAGIETFFTEAVSGSAPRARRRAARMKS